MSQVALLNFLHYPLWPSFLGPNIFLLCFNVTRRSLLKKLTVVQFVNEFPLIFQLQYVTLAG